MPLLDDLLAFWTFLALGVASLVLLLCPSVRRTFITRPLFYLGGLLWSATFSEGSRKAGSIRSRYANRRLIISQRNLGENKSPFVDYTLYLKDGDENKALFEVFPRGTKDTITKIFDIIDPCIGEAHFDERFQINCSKDFDLANFFSSDFCSLVFQIQRACQGGDFYLRSDHSLISVCCEIPKRRPPDSRELQGMAKTLFQRCLSYTKPSAPPLSQAPLPSEAMEVQVVSSEEEPLCQICGDSIEDEHCRCAACGTAHHIDCWDYNGRCSTYACNCTEQIHSMSRV